MIFVTIRGPNIKDDIEIIERDKDVLETILVGTTLLKAAFT